MSLRFYAGVQLFVGVFTLVVFPIVACFFDRGGERHKDRVLTRFFSVYDSFAYGNSQLCSGVQLLMGKFLILVFSTVASYTQVFIVYT